METASRTSGFNKRAFLSLAMVMSGLILCISGYANHVLQFSAFTQERHFWMAAHNMAASIFVVSAIAHAVLNRSALMRYCRQKVGMLLSREAIAAVVVVLTVVGAFASHAFHVR